MNWSAEQRRLLDALGYEVLAHGRAMPVAATPVEGVVPSPRAARPARRVLVGGVPAVRPSDEVDVLFIDDEPSDIQLPSSVELEVTETEPGLRGDTASGGGNKPATLETGAVVQVPLFLNEGEIIRVDRREDKYIERVSR